MELIERSQPLTTLQHTFSRVIEGEGHCVLVSGESGIGKTSLVRIFCNLVKNKYKIYHGSCDALFTPRPLAPFYDLVWQVNPDFFTANPGFTDRTAVFVGFFHELEKQELPSVILIEDIHWADEATLDFIKFFARRITRLQTLLILTFRDTEIYPNHPFRSVLGQLPPHSFSRLQLNPLSREAVEKMALQKGYKGEDVYTITGGNPFYVNEILASYSPGIPDNIKDAVLSVYNDLDEKTKQVWQLLSVIPTAFETGYLEKIEPMYATALKNCMEKKILIVNDGKIFFKHELYRRTIENSLSPLLRMALNKKILDLLQESFERKNETERIIHHAKNANEHQLVVQFAPIAAKQAASLGAHIEASKLYLTAIEYYQQKDPVTQVEFYRCYSYECYLTSQIKEAIIYQEKALVILKRGTDKESIGDCMRFLSRLWWFEGNIPKAETYGQQAIEMFTNEPPSKGKAMAYSNMSHLKMLEDRSEQCVEWGSKAMAMARELADEEILCHALNNVGSVLMRHPATYHEGIAHLQQSLDIALRNSYHEHVARAYINLGNNAVTAKEFPFALDILKKGIDYCEERDMDSWKKFALLDKAKLLLGIGSWDEALEIALDLIRNEEDSLFIKADALIIIAKIRMRKNEGDVIGPLNEAKSIVLKTMQAPAIIPVITAILEYEWITAKRYLDNELIDTVIGLVQGADNGFYMNSEFAYWMMMAGRQNIPLEQLFEGFLVNNPISVKTAVRFWEKSGCPYEQALVLFESNEDDKKKAVSIVQKLGATAVCEKMKMEMREAGIKKIPRGMRKSTQSNAALLTQREMDVLELLKEGLQNKEIGNRLYISAKTVDHHISSILFKLDVSSRMKAVQEATTQGILK